jgi:hypothetical protein
MPKNRLSLSLLLALALSLVLVVPAFAGSPHFVKASCTPSGFTLTCTGTEAGLGTETQVHITMTADALCVNGGGNHPKASNKTSVTAAGDFPVQNGHADFTLSKTATFQPDCSPPMTVVFQNIVLTDAEHGVVAHL